jgi:NAD(P)-dependent dehydrogenase (short-subunit alcohol dehydrogenase family)
VVTGGASGLGQAFALQLARDGARVVIADLDEGTTTLDQVRAAGGDGIQVRCDVASEDDVAALAHSVEADLGPADILVNNAGVSPNVAWDDLDLAEWRRVMAINLDAMFLTCKAFSGAMRGRGWGRIVNVTSNTFGLVIEGFAHYVASKGGVIGFTRALASDLGPDGVTVNAIAPGLTHTPTTDRMWTGTSLFGDMAQLQAVKREGVPSDLAGAVSFLASDDAGFITGQTLVVDGGLVRH